MEFVFLVDKIVLCRELIEFNHREVIRSRNLPVYEVSPNVSITFHVYDFKVFM